MKSHWLKPAVSCGDWQAKEWRLVKNSSGCQRHSGEQREGPLAQAHYPEAGKSLKGATSWAAEDRSFKGSRDLIFGAQEAPLAAGAILKSLLAWVLIFGMNSTAGRKTQVAMCQIDCE